MAEKNTPKLPSKGKPQAPVEIVPTDPVEKGFKSKKFIAYMSSSFMWKALLFWMVHSWGSGFDHQLTILITVVVSGFVDVGYIVSVAALDKYVRVARITAGRTT